MSGQEASATGIDISYREWLEKVWAGELPPPPIASLIGFRVVAAEIGTARVELEASRRHANPMGTLHGGVLCDMGDAAMGCALGSTLERGETFTTIELKANYFKPIWESQLVANARIVKKTRSLAALECDIIDEKGSLVARLSSTCLLLRGEQARGR